MENSTRDLENRIAKLSTEAVLSLLEFNINEKPGKDQRLRLNKTLIDMLESEEIDEMELLIWESGE
jgi:hypothetical protein